MTPVDPEYLASEYKKFLEFYNQVNLLVIAAERESIDGDVSISAVVELRSAFTHIMRVHSVQYGLVPEAAIQADSGFTPAEYCRQNLSKAFGHLYRAGYDSYDGMALALDVEIGEMLSAVSQTTIYSVIENAREAVFQKRATARQMIDYAKTRKDVEDPEAGRQRFRELEGATSLLLETRELLLSNMAPLVGYERAAWRRTMKAAVIGGLVVLLLTYPLSRLADWLVPVIRSALNR